MDKDILKRIKDNFTISSDPKDYPGGIVEILLWIDGKPERHIFPRDLFDKIFPDFNGLSLMGSECIREQTNEN